MDISRFTFKTFSVKDPVSTYTITWQWMDAVAAFDAYQRSMPFTDRRLTSQMIIGYQSISATGIFLGPQSELLPLLVPVITG